MGDPTPRYTDDDGYEEGADYDTLSPECEAKVMEFDDYCHNADGGEQKYSDFRVNGECTQCTVDADTGLCTDKSLEP